MNNNYKLLLDISNAIDEALCSIDELSLLRQEHKQLQSKYNELLKKTSQRPIVFLITEAGEFLINEADEVEQY